MREPDEPDGDLLLCYLDPSFGSSIAMAISEWARFEYRLDEAIWELAGVEPEIGACITCQLSTVVSRFNALIALARSLGWDEKTVGKLNKLQRKSLGTADGRNRIAHDPWFAGYFSKDHFRLQKTARAKLEYAYKLVSVEELEKIRNDSLALSDELEEILREKYSQQSKQL